jgi:hypothetical protein
MTKEAISKLWEGLQHRMSVITPGASIKSSSGAFIDVSANGTTSMSSDQLEKVLRQRFSEMHEAKNENAE